MIRLPAYKNDPATSNGSSLRVSLPLRVADIHGLEDSGTTPVDKILTGELNHHNRKQIGSSIIIDKMCARFIGQRLFKDIFDPVGFFHSIAIWFVWIKRVAV